MAQINQDIVIYAGAYISLRFEGIFKEDTNEILLASDIIGAEWGMTPFEDEVTPIISKSLGSGIIIPIDGVVVVTLSEQDTDGLSGEFSHELRLLGTGGVSVASRGKVSVRFQISNNPV